MSAPYLFARFSRLSSVRAMPEGLSFSHSLYCFWAALTASVPSRDGCAPLWRAPPDPISTIGLIYERSAMYLSSDSANERNLDDAGLSVGQPRPNLDDGDFSAGLDYDRLEMRVRTIPEMDSPPFADALANVARRAVWPKGNVDIRIPSEWIAYQNADPKFGVTDIWDQPFLATPVRAQRVSSGCCGETKDQALNATLLICPVIAPAEVVASMVTSSITC